MNMVRKSPQSVAAAKKLVQERLRDRIDPELQLQSIESAVRKLEVGAEQIGDSLALVPLDSVRVVALGKAIDTRLKLLGKILPDLKAVELTGDATNPLVTVDASKTELAVRLLHLFRTRGITIAEQDDTPDFLK